MTLKLTKIARKAIEDKFNDDYSELDEETKKKYKEKKASFVTLTKNRKLRGCVGSLEARRELFKDVQENAIHAAFNDNRFQPLKKEELEKIKIEVSVLSNPKQLEFETEKDLLNKINNKMGLILKKGFLSATFLPQVWEELDNKKDFLEHLSVKAGLSKDSWKYPGIEIWYYNVVSEKEE